MSIIDVFLIICYVTRKLFGGLIKQIKEISLEDKSEK